MALSIETAKAFIDYLRANSDETVWKPILCTEKPGCGIFYKGRGANSFESVFGINLSKVIKKSAFQVKIGDINYADVKEANGFGSEVKARTGDMSWVPGYERILLVNNKTGEYLLRCYIDKTTTHYDTNYFLEDGTKFDTKNPAYKPYLRENAQEVDEDFIHMFDIKLSNVASLGGV